MDLLAGGANKETSQLEGVSRFHVRRAKIGGLLPQNGSHLGKNHRSTLHDRLISTKDIHILRVYRFQISTDLQVLNGSRTYNLHDLQDLLT